MINHEVIPYLKSKGLKVDLQVDPEEVLYITAKGENLDHSIIMLNSKRNYTGGYDYYATFITPINIDESEANKIMNEIMEEYGPPKTNKSGFTALKRIPFEDCRIVLHKEENIGLLFIFAVFSTIDNKNPGYYCYDMFLKGFIQDVDECSSIWL